MTELHERLDELLVQRATEGLDPEETRLLNQLLAEHPDVEAEWVDRLVGEVDAELLASTEEVLSPQLRSALLASGPAAAPTTAAPPAEPSVRTSSRWNLAGWAMAAVLAAIAFGPLLGGEGPSPEPEPPTFGAVASASDAVVATWTPGEDVTGAQTSGEVVWSAARQEGVMRFRGLAPNDPSDFQYQLWIFDAGRDERYPVDGGVFDVPSGSDEFEVVIRAKLDVADATLFAVTVEEPGGVVVSTRERIATLAQLSQ